MLKAYSSRVWSTYHLLASVGRLVNRDFQQIINNKVSADAAVAQQKEFALSWLLDEKKFDLNKADKKAKYKIHEQNKLAFKELVLSIHTSTGDGQVTFQLICCCRSNDYKNSNTADTWKWLQDKYAPNLMPMKLELKSEFQHSKLQDVIEDPDVWISKLESICTILSDMQAPISDEDFIVHVLNNLPIDYEV